MMIQYPQYCRVCPPPAVWGQPSMCAHALHPSNVSLKRDLAHMRYTMHFVHLEFEASRTIRKRRTERVKRRQNPRHDRGPPAKWDPPEHCPHSGTPLSDTVMPWVLQAPGGKHGLRWYEPNPAYVFPHPSDTTYRSDWG